MATVINNFLRRCMEKVSSKVQPLTVVLGNEGGDMDSIVGSIYFAMLLESSSTWNIENPVPAVNFPLEDWVLRNDVVKLFEEIGVDASLVMSVQKGESPYRYIDLVALDANVYLFDHNKLTRNQEAFESKVVGILDHHKDEKKHTELTVERRIVRTVGSACTLVAECYQFCDANVPCPALLDAPIILDNVYFDPYQKKVTPEDIIIHQYLVEKINDKSYDPRAIYDKLIRWRRDIGSLTVAESIRRDYKRFDFPLPDKESVMTMGISSVPCSCPEFEKKYGVPHIIAESMKFMQSRELDVLVFAFAGMVNEKYTREITFCAKPDIMEVFVPFIADSSNNTIFSLMTESATNDKSYLYASYSLNNTALSRKDLVPALRKFLVDGGDCSSLRPWPVSK